MNIQMHKQPKDIPTSSIDKVVQYLEENRRYFGIAATGLRNQIKDPRFREFYKKDERGNVLRPNKKKIEFGIKGECETSKILRKWIEDKEDVVLFDSIHLPTKEQPTPEIENEDDHFLDTGDTDHALVIGNKIVLVDSKMWKSKCTYMFNEDKTLLRNNKEFYGNRPKIHQMKYLWVEYLKDLGICESIEALVCVVSPDDITRPNIVRNGDWWYAGYKLTNQKDLTYFLNMIYNEDIKASDKGFVRPEILVRILRGLIKPYDEYSEFGVINDIANGKVKVR